MVKIVETQSGFDLEKLIINVSDIGKKKLYVGFPESAKYDGNTPVAGIAAIQEYGDGYKRIPPRPFMRPTAEKHELEWIKYIEDSSQDILIGKKDFDTQLEKLGLLVAGQIKKSISQVYEPVLSLLTLALRKHRLAGKEITQDFVGAVNAAINQGKTGPGQLGDYSGVSTKPLIETGIMFNSVTSEVKSS